jgi:hypothetical protein
MGFLALGAVLVGDALDRRLARAGPDSRQARLLLPALLCVPAACLNPEGYHALLFPLLHTFIGPIVAVTEYAPTGALRLPAFWIVAALTAAALWRFRRSSAWSEILLAGGMALLGALLSAPRLFLVAAPLHRHATAAARRLEFTAAPGRRRTGGRAGALSWALGFERLLPYQGLGSTMPSPPPRRRSARRCQTPLPSLWGRRVSIYQLYPASACSRTGVSRPTRASSWPVSTGSSTCGTGRPSSRSTG